VRVVSVQPGGITTPVWEKSRAAGERLLAEMAPDVRRRYEGVIEPIRRLAECMARDGLPPEAVAEVVGRAITARRPRTRYVVGREARVQAALVRLLPDRAFDALVRRTLTSGGRSGGRG
jgi:NAD(P)-dependent dehydrogenase (short-subunit alcohol dehydrogenase family)